MDISLIEWIVYGFFAYSSLLMLIISVIKDVPSGKSQSLIRVIYLIPGIICSAVLASSGVNIILNTTRTVTLHTFQNGSAMNSQYFPFNDTAIMTTNQVVLQLPIWQWVHYMIMVVLLVYVLTQLMNLMTKTE